MLDLLGVGVDLDELHVEFELDRRGFVLFLRFDQLGRLAHDFVEVRRGEVRAERTRVVEELRYDGVETVGLVDDHLEKLRLFSGLLVGIEILGSALDRAERIPDLVGKTGGHLTDRRETIALGETTRELRVLDHRDGRVADAHQQSDLFRGVRLGHPVISQRQEAQHPITRDERQ